METVSVAELRKNISDLLSKVAYAGDRIVIERRGKPVAVVVSLDDLKRLQSLEDKGDRRARRLEWLARADALRESIRTRRGGVPLPDSAELIHELREERMRELDPTLR